MPARFANKQRLQHHQTVVTHWDEVTTVSSVHKVSGFLTIVIWLLH